MVVAIDRIDPRDLRLLLLLWVGKQPRPVESKQSGVGRRDLHERLGAGDGWVGDETRPSEPLLDVAFDDVPEPLHGRDVGDLHGALLAAERRRPDDRYAAKLPLERAHD